MGHTELDGDLEDLWQVRAQRIRTHLPAALPLTVGDGRCPHTHDPVQVLSGGDKWLIRTVHAADAAWRRLWPA